jgi:hypothetical protein
VIDSTPCFISLFCVQFTLHWATVSVLSHLFHGTDVSEKKGKLSQDLHKFLEALQEDGKIKYDNLS